jgi:hypothetical protein
MTKVLAPGPMLPCTAQYAAGLLPPAGTMVADEMLTVPPTAPLMAPRSIPTNAPQAITGLMAGRSLMA